MDYSGELPPQAGEHRRGRAAPAGRVTAGRPSRRQRLRLERPNTPSAHLILATDRQMNGSCLMKSRGLVDWPPWTRSTDRGPIPPIFQ
jgi:hypothetical protein